LIKGTSYQEQKLPREKILKKMANFLDAKHRSYIFLNIFPVSLTSYQAGLKLLTIKRRGLFQNFSFETGSDFFSVEKGYEKFCSNLDLSQKLKFWESLISHDIFQ
jgi:hypothetical protein